MLCGVLLGGTLFGGAAAFAAAGITAYISGDRVFVNGAESGAEMYKIGGSNFLKLRDSSRIADISVVYDADAKRVLIDTSRGYDPDERLTAAPTSAVPATGGYGTAPKILKPDDTVKTANGDYTVNAGQLERLTELERHGLEFGRPLAPDAPLPAWRSEWDGYPRVAIPDVQPVRSAGDIVIQGQKVGTHDSLTVFNAYEVERMIRTIYKYAENNANLWMDRDPSTGIPNFTITVERTEGLGFYPWENAVVPGEETVSTKVANGRAGTVFRIYAADEYNKGKYLDTQYFMQ
jgi:hypothetical protein